MRFFIVNDMRNYFFGISLVGKSLQVNLPQRLGLLFCALAFLSGIELSAYALSPDNNASFHLQQTTNALVLAEEAWLEAGEEGDAESNTVSVASTSVPLKYIPKLLVSIFLDPAEQTPLAFSFGTTAARAPPRL